MNRINKLAFLSLLISIPSGCGQQPTRATSMVATAQEDFELRWVDGPEHSHFYKADDDSWAVRCWQFDKNFDCLQVTNSTPRSSGETHRSYGFLRAKLEKLPNNLFNFSGQGTYDCEYGEDSLREAISKNGDTLTSHLVLLHEPMEHGQPWSREFVYGYASKNGLTLQRSYVPCELVGAALMSGSLATLGTTTISLKDLDQTEEQE
jgi:hypothetical protein